MPQDIRSFFGGGPKSTPIREKEKDVKKEDDSKKKRAKSRKIIDDSDDDEPAPPSKKATPKPAVKKAVKKESPKGQETSTADYFASSSKPKAKSTPTKSKAPPAATNGRSSARKKTAPSYKEDDEDEAAFLDDGEDSGEDIFAADVKAGGRRKDDGYVEIKSDDDLLPQPKKVTTKSTSGSGKKVQDVDMKDVSDTTSFVMVDDDDMDIDVPIKSSKKRKSVDLESESEEDSKPKKAAKSKSAKPPPAKKQRAPTKKAAPAQESDEIKALLASIPTVRAPTPPPKDPNVKHDWRAAAGGGGNAGPPPGAGSKEIPVGADNCLAGMTFVFTGLLETISRDEGQELVKRYGGKVTGQPSRNTTFVVLGNDAGPSKLRKIAELKIKSINEDGLFELIRKLPSNGGDGKAAAKNNEKKAEEAAKIKKEAAEMEAEERRKAKEAEIAEKEAQKRAALKGAAPPPPARKPPPSSSQLWTSKYAPTAMNQICGNKGQVEKIQNWLKGWKKAHKYEFMKKGADGTGGYRAIIIHGPPGIGKTTAAHLAAKLAGYDVLESNASDTRSKKMVESGVTDVLNNRSLLGYFAGDGKTVDATKQNIVLIMDEVDGMSAGDRGGVGALARLCKKTDIPMILICNERRQPKMKPFDHVTLDIPFRRPTTDQVRSRIATICLREGLKLPMQVIEALIEGSNKDIRQIINMISTAKLDQDAMDFDKGKAMSKAWEKHVVLKPWDICSKMLGGGLFAPASKATLNDKIELYFNDHEFSYLMIQENYLKTKPMLASNTETERHQTLKTLQLAERAAESISDGDLVDRMIHGSQQQWSLMPTHAVFSSVRPASFISGLITGRTDFTSWLGQNSKTQKLTRYVKEIQSHMRLKSSGDRHEIRQQYLPVLWTLMIGKLKDKGRDCIDDVIELMDSYYLTRDDYDYILELGLGPQDMEGVNIETQTKAAFTREYNSKPHSMPFMKASNVMAPAKSTVAKPDLEEAIEEEDDEEVVAEPKQEDDEDDIKKDKYIKQPKKKKAAGAKKTASKKKGAKDEGDDDEDDFEEDVKPKKGRGKAAAKGKGKK